MAGCRIYMIMCADLSLPCRQRDDADNDEGFASQGTVLENRGELESTSQCA